MSAVSHTLPRHITEQQVRTLIKARRSRSNFLPADLFADPAWDILLALYAAKLSQRKLSVTSVCAATVVRQSTALRWLTALENMGLIIRSADPLDGRRYFVELSISCAASMDAYFGSLGVGVAVV
jgi:DNA-binding MarR family transcriptional regulator